MWKIIFILPFLLSGCTPENTTEQYKNILINAETVVGIMDGYIEENDVWAVSGLAGQTEDGRDVIAVDSSHGEYSFARVMIHELAHVQFREVDGCVLPVQENSDNKNKEKCSERIAMWYEDYVFNREKLKAEYSNVIEFFDKLVKELN